MGDDYETVRRWVDHNVRLHWVNRYGDHTTAWAYAIMDGQLRVVVGGGGFMDTPIAEAEERFTESTVVGGL